MDYSKPITAGEVLRYTAAGLTSQAQRIRREIAALENQVFVLERAASDIESDADRWDQYQPKPPPATDDAASSTAGDQ